MLRQFMEVLAISCLCASGAISQIPTTGTLEVTPDPLNFGEVHVGGTSFPDTVSIENTDLLLPVEVTGISPPNDTAFVQTMGGTCPTPPFTLNGGASCTVEYTFTPPARGASMAQVTINSDAQNDPVTFTLAGTGKEPVLMIDPVGIDFGAVKVGTQSEQQVITLTNTGNDNLLVLGLDAPLAPFAREPGGCAGVPFSLGVGAFCTLTYSFSPSAQGSASQTLTIMSNASSSPDSLTLQGTGAESILTITPTTVDFKAVKTGTTSLAQTVTLTSSGQVALDISAIDAPMAPFARIGGSCGAAPFSLSPADSCTLDYQFSPTAASEASLTIRVSSDAVAGSDNQFTLAGSGAQPGLGLAPASLAFGNVTVGQTSPAQTVSLSNTGSADLIVGSLVLSGDNAADFALAADNCSGQTLAPAANCSFDVTLTPNATGMLAAQVDVPSDATTSPDIVPLSGTGVQPGVGLTPTSLAFGNVTVGQTSTAQTVSLNNTGSADLNVGSLVLSGDNATDFALAADNCSGLTLAPAANCSFDVTLTPSATGGRFAQVDIPSNAPFSPDAVPLTGNGTAAPMIMIMPSKVVFGEQPLGTTSDAQMIIIENIGTAELIIDPLIITGLNSDDFSIGMDTCSAQTLGTDSGVDNFCGVEISFHPVSPGLRGAHLQIESNDPDSPDQVELHGTNNVQFTDGFEDP
ncbi:MAG: choice-of-anchor D domain-containing protein [Gammaproteobacteria bacterium]|nr:choice-of-anchor D domain-containing protein [Gammaproteobacteria bacterium]